MADNLDRTRVLFKLNERVFAGLGVWPLQAAWAKFTVWFVYQLVHTVAITADFFDVFGNLNLMILNFGENAWNVMVIFKMLVMRFSQKLVDQTERVIDDADPETFMSPKEEEIYLKYSRIAVKFFKLWVFLMTVASLVVQVKPLDNYFRTGAENESVVLTLPYRTWLFFDLNTFNFWFVWAYQIPVIYLNAYQGATIGYVCTFVLHVCGQMSVLAFRVRSIGTNEGGETSKVIFRDVVVKHRKILGMVEDINGVFSLLLLEELLLSTIIIGFAAYNVILNLDANTNSTVVIVASLLESGTILLMIYGYCYAGEYLVAEGMTNYLEKKGNDHGRVPREFLIAGRVSFCLTVIKPCVIFFMGVQSANLYTSYYQCPWYAMSETDKKQLMICMIGACKPVQLVGGGFYIFSLASFTSVVKTAAGYISMLRTVV